MQKKILALMMTSALLVLSACQPPSGHSASSSSEHSEQTKERSASQSLSEAKTPRELTNALVDISEKKLKERLICSKLSDTIEKVGSNSTIEDIQAVQHQLGACLPVADNTKILQWLTAYQAMYKRFLGADSYWDDEAFYSIVDTMERGKIITVAQLKQLSPRTRYLIGLIRNKSDVSVLYVGEGLYTFHHNLQAMADLFSPYLPKEQAAFIERMAKDNQDIFWKDASVAISYQDLIERATFWEDYIKQYPNSYFIDDAKHLFNTYRYLLFFGTDNTQWTNDAFNRFLTPEYKLQLRQLLKRQNSKLAQDAQVFLAFMAMSDRERQQQYPISKIEEDKKDNEKERKARDESKTPYYQLKEALAIPSPEDFYDNKDCLSGITCIDQEHGINSKDE